MPSSPRFFHFRDRPDWSPSNLNIDVSRDKCNPPGARRRAGRPFAKMDENPVRYFGYYSNKSRCLRKKAQADDQIPAIMPNEMSSSKFRQNWARLIQKIYEVDPLICPKCQGPTRIIAFIEDDRIVQKLLKIWDYGRSTTMIRLPPILLSRPRRSPTTISILRFRPLTIGFNS